MPNVPKKVGIDATFSSTLKHPSPSEIVNCCTPPQLEIQSPISKLGLLLF